MADNAAVQAMVAIRLKVGSCGHCGKQLVSFKRCSVCKQRFYCGVACQNADWKKHKKKCVPPLSRTALRDVKTKVFAGHANYDWREVLKWEGYMEELVVDNDEYVVLLLFCTAHQRGSDATGSEHHILAIIRLGERRVELMGRLQRFRDQASAMCVVADHLVELDKMHEAASLFQRARAIGAAHGFFSAECHACLGLGGLAMNDGHHAEGLDLLRNALAAAPLVEGLDHSTEAEHVTALRIQEMGTLQILIDALFKLNMLDEVEPLVLRYKKVAHVERWKGKHINYELSSLLVSARHQELRGRTQESERDVRAMIDLVSSNRAAFQDIAHICQPIMASAGAILCVLSSNGHKELIRCWAIEMASLGWSGEVLPSVLIKC